MLWMILALSLNYICLSETFNYDPKDYKGMHSKEGCATVYYPGDGNCGKERADGRSFTKRDFHIAHRTLRLGTSGYLCSYRSRLCVKVAVRDRGPYGAVLSCRKKLSNAKGLGRPRLVKYGRTCYWWQAQIQLQTGWKRRGEFDITLPVARAIRHKAFDRVIFFYRKKTRISVAKAFTLL